MRPGMQTSSAPGDTADMILDLKTELIGSGMVRIRFTPVTGYGDRFFHIYVNGKKSGIVYAEEGKESEHVGLYDGAPDRVAVAIEDGGDWSDLDYDPSFVAEELEAGSANKIAARWAGRWTLEDYGDGGQLSSWTLTGLRRFSNLEPVTGKPTQGRLGIALTDATGTRTVVLYAGETPIASGSRSGDGAITLAEQNESGVAGTVTVAYSADIALADGAYVYARWPASYQIHYSTSALSFPRTPEATTADDGGNVFSYVSSSLSAGTYNVAVVAVSDTGIADSAPTTPATVTIYSNPEAPTNLAYTSGGIAATVISWTASATTGVTYNVYDSDIDEPTNLETPIATGVSALTYTLPDKTGQEPGTRRVVVRTVKSGVEEKNSNALAIEYDAAGVRVPARPNSPFIGKIEKTAGRTVTVIGSYDANGESGTATKLQLFIWADGGTPNYTTPDDEETLDTGVAGLKQATLAATIAVNGYYRLGIRAATVAGTQDVNTDSVLVFVSDADPADVVDFVAAASRG